MSGKVIPTDVRMHRIRQVPSSRFNFLTFPPFNPLNLLWSQSALVGLVDLAYFRFERSLKRFHGTGEV